MSFLSLSAIITISFFTIMFIAHAATGLTATYATKRVWDKKDFSKEERGILYAFGIFFATLPDFDIAIALINGFENHRAYITHTPYLYIIAALTIFLASLLKKMPCRYFLRSASFLLLISTMTHLITDIIAAEVMLLYPFSEYKFSIFSSNPIIETDCFITAYFATPLLASIEFILLTSGFWILFKRVQKEKISYNYPLFTLIGLTLVSTIATVIFTFHC